MSVINAFRFVGVCYGDARRVSKKDKSYYTRVTIVVKSYSSPNDPHYVPLIFTGKLAEKSAIQCRNGNLISVSGEIVSRERFDNSKGSTQIQVYFIANDLLLLTKAYKKRLSSKSFSDLVQEFAPEEFSPPERSTNDKHK